MTATGSYDVAILGGGLAGLTLAIQIKRRRPETSIVIVEKNTHPVAEAAHKVGESTGELSSFYFREVIGMKEHLESQQLIKFGLRFFFTAGNNTDITRRVEVGPVPYSRVDTYQLDRGRFENALGEKARELGAEFWDGSKIVDVEIAAPLHTVTVQRGDTTTQVQAHWVVDASGRAAILKRKFGLAKAVDHDINTAWWRISVPMDVDEWTDDREFHARVPGKQRRFSTTHLVGRGYWVWLIPLSSGSHSIGIVADSQFHPFDQINTWERAMQWLHRHEPQLAQQLEARRDLRQDFRVLKHFSFSTEQMYSTDRWCLTGEAGVFNDPFYSPGSDFIAICNTYVCDLIVRERNGEDIEELVAFYDEGFRNAFEFTLPLWRHKYPLYGNAHVMTAKHAYDQITYWGFIALPFFRHKFHDPEYFASILPHIIRMGELTERVEAFFLEWDELDRQERRGAFVDILNTFPYSLRTQWSLIEDLDDEALAQRMEENLHLLERIAAEMFRKAAPLVKDVPKAQAINPYAMSLKPERWEEDGLFDEENAVPHDPEIAANLDKILFNIVPA